jgi:hypothetical protein
MPVDSALDPRRAARLRNSGRGDGCSISGFLPKSPRSFALTWLKTVSIPVKGDECATLAIDKFAQGAQCCVE